MKTINILGITLKHYSLREALRETDKYLKNGALNTVLYVSKKQLMRAAGNEQWKGWLEGADLTVCADSDILSMDETISAKQAKEIENYEYLGELLKRIVRNHRKVFLLADNETHRQTLREVLLHKQGRLDIAGEAVLTETETGDDGNLINEINDVAPAVVIAQLPFEELCHFVDRNRMYLNADVILGLPEEGVTEKKPHGVFRLAGYAYRKRFRHKVKKYNHKEKTE